MKCIISDKSPARALTKQQPSFNRRANVLAVGCCTSHTKAPLCATFRVPFLFCYFFLQPFVLATLYSYTCVHIFARICCSFVFFIHSMLLAPRYWLSLSLSLIFSFFLYKWNARNFLGIFSCLIYTNNTRTVVNKGHKMLLNNFYSFFLFLFRYMFSYSILCALKYCFYDGTWKMLELASRKIKFKGSQILCEHRNKFSLNENNRNGEYAFGSIEPRKKNQQQKVEFHASDTIRH